MIIALRAVLCGVFIMSGVLLFLMACTGETQVLAVIGVADDIGTLLGRRTIVLMGGLWLIAVGLLLYK